MKNEKDNINYNFTAALILVSLMFAVIACLSCENAITGNAGSTNNLNDILPAPKNLKAAADKTSLYPRVTLTWTPVPDAVYYVIYRSNDSTWTDYLCLTSTHSTTIYTDTSSTLKTGLVSYRIGAKKGFSSSPIGDLSGSVEVNVEIYIPDTTVNNTTTNNVVNPLPAPENLNAELDGNSSTLRVIVTWTPVVNATYYYVYRSTVPDWSDFICLSANLVATTVYPDTSFLKAGTTYYYRVGAKKVTSDPLELSDHVEIYIPHSGVSGLSASVLSQSSIRVMWNPVERAIKYRVYRALSSSASADWEPVAYLDSPEFTDTLLTPRTTYYYRVSVIDNNGKEEPRSNSFTNATTSSSITPPGNLAATANGMIITLTWDAVEGASTYYIFGSFSEEGPYALINSLSANLGTAYMAASLDYLTDIPLRANTTYHFKVSTGGTKSDSVSATTGS